MPCQEGAAHLEMAECGSANARQARPAGSLVRPQANAHVNAKATTRRSPNVRRSAAVFLRSELEAPGRLRVPSTLISECYPAPLPHATHGPSSTPRPDVNILVR